MILDERTEFADATALNTGAPASFLIGDVIDLGSVARDIGDGSPLFFVVSVDTAVTSAGAATVQFSLASDAQAAIAVDGSQTTHFASAAIPKATLIAGYTAVIVALPPEGAVYERFLGLVQTTGTAALTAGKVNAFLTKNAAKYRAYPDAVS